MQEIAKYINIVRKWWWVIAALFVTTVGTMMIISTVTEKEYLATTKVRVSAPPPQELPLYTNVGRDALSEEISAARTAFSEMLLEGDVAYLTLQAMPDVTMSTRRLREKIVVESPRESQLMYISVSAPDALMAAELANKVVETGLQQFGQLNALPTVSNRQFIEQQLQLAEADQKATEAALAQFQIEHKVGSLRQAIENQADLIRQLKVQRDLAQATGDTTEAKALETIVLEREAELQNLIALSGEYNELTDRATRFGATHDFLLDRLSEATIKENQILEVSYVQVLTPARPPTQPNATIDARIIVLGGVVSILVGILLAFALEYLELEGVFRSFKEPRNSSDVVVLSE